MSALHWACSRGHLDAVKLLIEFRAFPNHMESTEDRYTPLGECYPLMCLRLAVTVTVEVGVVVSRCEGLSFVMDCVPRQTTICSYQPVMSPFNSFPVIDYALMGEYHDVAQFMIEQGGLSITGIQDIAACKVQVRIMEIISITKSLEFSVYT